MAINRKKYQHAILYLLHECGNELLGETKLMKLLYYLDFGHFERFRTSVTGDVYRRQQYGPVPVTAGSILTEMERHGLITHWIKQRGPYPQDRYDPLKPFDPSWFTESELQILEAVAQRWRDVEMGEIVRASHLEQPWLATPPGEIVSYRHAFNRDPQRPLSPRQREDMIQAIIGSHALEGLHFDYDEVARAVDEVLSGPPVQLRGR
jgi:hypothetical protein